MPSLVKALAPYITQAEAARRLHVPAPSIPRLIASGNLKARESVAGIRNTILASSVDELLARMQVDDRQAG